MPRGISSALLTALSDPSNKPVLFSKLKFNSGNINRSTSRNSLTFGGDTYTSDGDIITMSNIRESKFFDADPVTITYRGTNSTLLNIALTEDYQGREAEVYLGALNSSEVLIVNPELIFRGDIDVIGFVESENTITLTVTIESKLADMNRPRQRFYTHEDQQLDFPGDLGLEFARTLEDKDLKWLPHLGPQLWKYYKDPWGSHMIFQGGMITVQQAVSPRRYLYGEQRIGGTLVFAHIAGDVVFSNTILHAVIAVCDGPIKSIGDLYVNDDLVELDSDGNAINQGYEVSTVSGVNTGGLFTLTDTASGFNALDLAPDDVVRVRGSSQGVFLLNRDFKVSTVTADTLVLFSNIFININTGAGDLIKLTKRGGEYTGKLRVIKHLGSTTQAADSLMLADIPEVWTSAHQLKGIAYLYVRMNLNEDVFTNGMPNFTVDCEGFESIVDSRTGTTGYTTNGALVIAHFLGLGGYPLGLNDATTTDDGLITVAASGTTDDGLITASVTSTQDDGLITDPIGNILISALNTAADCADEDVTLKAGGTEKRYTINALIDSSQAPLHILASLRDAIGGDIVYSGGNWIIKCGKYVVPTVTLTENAFLSPLIGMMKRPLSELFNVVRGEYIRADDNFLHDEYPVYKSLIRIDEVGNRELFTTIFQPHIGSAATAMRLAKMAVERIFQHKSFRATYDLRAIELIASDTVNINYARFSWTNKVFEVEVLDFIFSNEDNSPTIQIVLDLRELSSTFDDWNEATEEIIPDPPKTPNFPPTPFRIRLIRAEAALKDTENVFNLPQANLEVDDTQRFNAGGGNYTWFASDQNVFISINKDITIPSMIQMVKGAQYLLNIEQDGTGGHSITFTGASWQFVGNIAPKLGQSAFEATQFVFMGVTVGGPNGPVKLRGVAQKFPA